MNEKIVQLINYYNLSGRYVDREFYSKFFEIIKSDLGLENYLFDMIFIEKENHDDIKYKKYTEGLAGLFAQAAYMEKTGYLIIYERNIEWGKRQELLFTNFNGSSSEVIMFNLLVLQTLLHEIEHAKQNKAMKENNDFESELLRILDTDIPETTSTYECDIKERLAELRSFKFIMDIYQYLNLDVQEIYEYFEQKYKKMLLHGYRFLDDKGLYTEKETDIFVSPTDEYAQKKHVDMNLYKELVKNVIEDERYFYGLSVSVSDYKKFKDELGAFQM